MKGTEKIISHIEADAKNRANEILDAAKAQCEEIKASYDAKAKLAYDKAIKLAEKESDIKLDGALRVNSMEEKKSTLALKQELVNASFDKAMQLFIELPTDTYEDFMVKLLTSSISYGDEEIIMNKRDARTIGDKVVARVNNEKKTSLTLSDSYGDFAGGLIARHGNIEVNSTLELILDMNKRELSGDVVKVLFG